MIDTVAGLLGVGVGLVLPSLIARCNPFKPKRSDSIIAFNTHCLCCANRVDSRLERGRICRCTFYFEPHFHAKCGVCGDRFLMLMRTSEVKLDKETS